MSAENLCAMTGSRLRASHPHCLVVWPHSGTGKFYEIVVGISEINALAAAFPLNFGLDFDSLIRENNSPRG